MPYRGRSTKASSPFLWSEGGLLHGWRCWQKKSGRRHVTGSTREITTTSSPLRNSSKAYGSNYAQPSLLLLPPSTCAFVPVSALVTASQRVWTPFGSPDVLQNGRVRFAFFFGLEGGENSLVSATVLTALWLELRSLKELWSYIICCSCFTAWRI